MIVAQPSPIPYAKVKKPCDCFYGISHKYHSYRKKPTLIERCSKNLLPLNMQKNKNILNPFTYIPKNNLLFFFVINIDDPSISY